jgi:hypothetical protein
MAVHQISRFGAAGASDVVFTNSASTTGGFGYALHSGGLMYVAATSTGAAVTLTFGSRSVKDGPYFVAHDSSNNPVTLTVEPGKCYQVPDEVFAAPFVSATCNGLGETVTVKVALKG